MGNWNDDFVDASLDSSVNRGMYIYNHNKDNVQAWTITLCYKKSMPSSLFYEDPILRNGYPILEITPTFSSELERLKAIFSPTDYTYKNYDCSLVKRGAEQSESFLKLEMKDPTGAHSQKEILSKLASILPDFLELETMLSDSTLLKSDQFIVKSKQSGQNNSTTTTCIIS